MLYILDIFKVLVNSMQYKEAILELHKMIQQFAIIYQFDSNQISCINNLNEYSKSNCRHALHSVFELYNDATTRPQRQYIADNRVVTFKL